MTRTLCMLFLLWVIGICCAIYGAMQIVIANKPACQRLICSENKHEQAANTK